MIHEKFKEACFSPNSKFRINWNLFNFSSKNRVTKSVRGQKIGENEEKKQWKILDNGKRIWDKTMEEVKQKVSGDVQPFSTIFNISVKREKTSLFVC